MTGNYRTDIIRIEDDLMGKLCNFSVYSKTITHTGQRYFVPKTHEHNMEDMNMHPQWSIYTHLFVSLWNSF